MRQHAAAWREVRGVSGWLHVVLEVARAERPDDPTAFRFVPTDYLVRLEGGRFAGARVDWTDALLSDVRAVARSRCPPEVVRRMGERLRALVEPAGLSRVGDAILGAVAERRPAAVTIRTAAAELHALPWELLPLASTGELLGRLDRVMIRYEWPETRTTDDARAPAAGPGRILFAASAAGGRVPDVAQLDALRRAAAEGHFAFDPARDAIADVSLRRLCEALSGAAAAGDPVAVLHLLCHAGGSAAGPGLVLRGDRGEAVLVGADELARQLAPHAGHLRLVVVSTCEGGPDDAGPHASGVAQALHRAGAHVVVGSRFPLSVPGAIRFAEAFYGELLVGPWSVERAFLVGRKRLSEDGARLDWAGAQLHARAADGDDSRPILFRPYRGLLTFQSKHSRFFFGRAAERREIASRAREALAGRCSRFQAVAGASGSGKSSLVLAGVVPDLTGPGEPWDVEVVRPAARGDLLRALAAAVRSGAPDGGHAWTVPQVLAEAGRRAAARPGRALLLVVDQLEELFTHGHEHAERGAFMQALWSLSRAPVPVVVLLTLRVDFLGRFGEIDVDDGSQRLRLDKVLYDRSHTFFVSQLGAAELRAVIEQPALRVGLAFEEGLVDQIRSEVGDDASALPLLEYALDELWKRRRGALLTQEAYWQMGGFKGALARSADDVVNAMSTAEQAQARRLLVRMVSPGEGGGEDTRRRAWTDALRPADPEAGAAFDHALTRLREGRLLVTGDDNPADPTAGAWAEVAHEALIRTWERLRRWVAEDREVLRRLASIERGCDEWAARRATPQAGDYLLHGNKLMLALELRAAHAAELTAPVRAFVAASEEAERARRRWRRLRVWLAIGGAVAVAAIAAVLALLVVPELTTGSSGATVDCMGRKCVKVPVSGRVDLTDVIPHATRLARSVEPSAVLCSVHMEETTDGTFVTRGLTERGRTLRLTYNVTAARLGAERSLSVYFVGPDVLALEHDSVVCQEGVFPIPLTCGPKEVYRAAVERGMPRGTLVSIAYSHVPVYGRPAWALSSNGSVHHRLVDPRTCKVTR